MKLRLVLAEDRDEILRRFEERFREEQGSSLSASTIRNHLPQFLDRVVAALDEVEGVTPGEDAADAAASHGAQRQGLGVDIKMLVREYGILRDVVLELLIERAQPVDLREFRLWSAQIADAASEAVSRYARERDSELMQSRANEVAFLAHELRNQLTVAVASVSWLRRRPREATEALLTIDATLQTMSSMLDRELMSERLRVVEAGAALHLEPIDAERMMGDVRSMYAPLAATRGVSIVAEADPGHTRLRADRRLLQSALSNLVGNAIKFTRDGGEIVVRLRSSKGMVGFEVEDSCGGLPPDALVRISTPWVQLGTDRSGFGLGVAIARRATEAHGGTLTIRDLPGKGCIFTMEVPRLQQEGEGAA
jgi:signal transduction histidine kinase